MYKPSKPKFGLHWINALFLIGFGGALIWSQLPTSSASQLHKLGMSPVMLGYCLITAGVLMVFTNQRGWHIGLTFVLMPYTVASFLLFYATQTAQSMTIYIFIQVAMVILAQVNSIVFRGEL